METQLCRIVTSPTTLVSRWSRGQVVALARPGSREGTQRDGEPSAGGGGDRREEEAPSSAMPTPGIAPLAGLAHVGAMRSRLDGNSKATRHDGAMVRVRETA